MSLLSFGTLHKAWNLYQSSTALGLDQVSSPKLIGNRMPCKLVCHLPKSSYKIMDPASAALPNIFVESSEQL